MDFIRDFRRGFRAARTGEWEDYEAPPLHYVPPRHERSRPDLAAALAASEAECRRLAGAIAERDREIEEARQLVSDAAGENDRLSSLNVTLSAEVAKLEAEAARLRGELAAAQKRRAGKDSDAKVSALELQVGEQAGELRRLRAEVVQLKALAAEPADDIKKVADRVWRVVAKSVHPDMSPKGETAKAALERVFKSVRAEIDQIKRASGFGSQL